jgi:hypothetical protein
VGRLLGPTDNGTAGGANGSYYLNETTVSDEAIFEGVNVLTGGSGQDWFWTGFTFDGLVGIRHNEFLDDQLFVG